MVTVKELHDALTAMLEDGEEGIYDSDCDDPTPTFRVFIEDDSGILGTAESVYCDTLVGGVSIRLKPYKEVTP